MVSVSTNLTELTSHTTYNYRLVAINDGGTTYGNNMTFTTGYKVGDELHGGTIFKVDGFYPNQTGLITWNENEKRGTWIFANYDRKDELDGGYAFYSEEERESIKKDRTRNGKYWFTPNINQLLSLIYAENVLVIEDNNYVSLHKSWYWTSETKSRYSFETGESIKNVENPVKYTEDVMNNNYIRLITTF